MRRVKAEVDDSGDSHVPMPEEDVPTPPAQVGSAPFPPECMAPLHGLLFLGALESTFSIAGHSFHIRTLTEGETLRIGQLVRDFRGSASEQEALRCYTVAACVVDVDGEQVAQPYKDGYDQIFESAKVVRKWFPPVVRAVYEEFSKLDRTAALACRALKN